jgi:hypothetical protein
MRDRKNSEPFIWVSQNRSKGARLSIWHSMTYKALLFCLVFQISCKTVPILQLKINPIRAALDRVPQSAIFSMQGYYLWDPSIIQVDSIYHLFCSRWPENTEMNGWKKSEIIRAESHSLFGPYEFKEVVLQPLHHPWATQGVHNPKIVKVGDTFLLYHLGIPKWQTGFAISKNISGPYEPYQQPVFNTGNPALIIKDNGSVYAVGKRRLKNEAEGKPDYFLEAFTASRFDVPFTPIKDMIEDTLNLLPHHYQLEDPTLWFANHTFHMICNDWKARATGLEKAMVYYTSKDGLDYQLVSKTPLWSHEEGIPMENETTTPLRRLERPQVFLNDQSEVVALMAAALPAVDKPSFIVIRPVKHFFPR